MSTLMDVRNPGRSRENDGQGIRDPPAQFYKSSWGSNFSNPNSDFTANHNVNTSNLNQENASALCSSSSSFASSSGSSFGAGSFSFKPTTFLGFNKTNQKISSEPSSSTASRDLNPNNASNATANFNPFSLPSSTSAFFPTRKSTPLCEVGPAFHPQTNNKPQRPRLVKVRRNNINSNAKGKSAAAFDGNSIGNLFSGRDCKNSFDDDVSGYNPFRSGAGSNQSSYCFGNQNLSATSSSFSTAFGDNLVNQGFNPGQNNGGLKSYARNHSTKENDDFLNQFSSWKPFVESSEVKNDAGVGVASCNSTFKKIEVGNFTFTAGAYNQAATTKEKMGTQAGSRLSAASGNNVNVGGTVNEVNNDRNSNDGQKPKGMNSGAADVDLPSQQAFVFNAVSRPKPRITFRHRHDLRSSSSAEGGGAATSSGTFQDIKIGAQSTYDNSYASQPSLFDSSGLEKNIGYTFDNPFASPAPPSGSATLKSSDAETITNPFAIQTPLSGPKFSSSAVNSSFGFTACTSMPSTFTFNAGGKVPSESKEVPKLTPLVEPFLFSAGSASATPVPQFPCGSAKDTANKDVSNISSSIGEMGVVPPALDTPRSGASSPKKDSHWPFMESLSSSLNGIFEFNTNKGASKSYSARKKREKIQLPASMRRKVGKQSASKSKRCMPSSSQSNNADGGSPMDFSPYNETAVKGEAPVGYDNMPVLEQSSAAWETPVHCGLNSFAAEAKVNELRAAAANLHIGAEEDKNSGTFHQEESFKGGEHQSWQTNNRADEDYHFRKTSSSEEHTSIPIYESEWLNSRMEKVKIEDQTSIPSSENDWLNSKMEKVRIEEQTSIPSSECEWLNSRMEKVRIDNAEDSNDVSKAEGSDQSKQFTFVASSPLNSTTPSRFSRSGRRSFRPKGAQNIHASSNGIKFDIPYYDKQPLDFERERMQGHISIPRGDKSQDSIQKSEDETVQKGEDETKGTGIHGSFFDGSTISDPFSFLPKQKEESGAGVSSAVKSLAAEQTCEKWRLRGNQAYANGDFPKAEDYYSRGASSISPNETSKSCIRASMLCYSNRAATRMAVGRMREALADCMRAMAIDPNFLRVQIRAASCHLSLGESEAAVSLFKGCLRLAKEVDNLDLKIAAEASEGLRKAQQGWEYTDRAAELLDTRNYGDTTNALRILNESLSISPHSEHLLELKTCALLLLRKYEDVIQVCEQSLDSAEWNYCLPNNDSQLGNEDLMANLAKFPIKLWRWRMSAKAYFHLGRLEDALDLVLKYEELNSAVEKSGKQSRESLAVLTATIRDLLRHKAAGNRAFQAGKHAEAVEHYTAALACNGESWPFTAVCFCNRAAASQALGHIADAIADCSRAIALDPNYPKAISRRATLHEMVRDYGQAVNDLQRLITLLERQKQGKGSQLGGLGSSNNGTQDLRQARDRLVKAEEEMKSEHPLDHYMILGVEASSSGAEIKKAYRKAALRHHPDKAGQFLVRSDSGDDSQWREVGEEVRRDAERLFKMIGEAYAILSDSSKRLRYDTEEEIRKLRTRGSSSGSETLSEPYRNQYEKCNRRHRDRWESWNGYANQYQRWQNGPDAAQPDTYAHRSSNSNRSSDGGRWNDWDYI